MPAGDPEDDDDRMSRDASASAVPPAGMPPRRGEQAGHGRPSELFDPGGSVGPAQPTGPAERFRASQLFEPSIPVTPPPDPGTSTAPGATAPGPTVPWRPAAPASSAASGGGAGSAGPSGAPAASGDAAAPDTEALPTRGASGSTPTGSVPPSEPSAPDGGVPPADDPPATGPADVVVPGSGPGADGPHPSGASPDGARGGPTTAPPHTPPPGVVPAVLPGTHGGPETGRHAPPPVPGRVPMPPGPSGAGPPTPPPVPAAPAAGRLRRLPVVLLVAAVFVAGLGYVGYRQLTSGPPDGYRAATSPGYELAVPQAWTPPAPGAPPLTVFGVPFGTAGQYGGYTCKGAQLTRAVAASALIAVPADVGLDQAATAFARGSGEALYPGAGPQVAVGTPTERELSTVTGSRVEATVRTDGSGGCRATDATVQVLVVPRTTAPDGSIGAAVLVVSGDLRGGPPRPAPVTRDDLVRVLDTAALSTG